MFWRNKQTTRDDCVYHQDKLEWNGVDNRDSRGTKTAIDQPTMATDRHLLSAIVESNSASFTEHIFESIVNRIWTNLFYARTIV